MMKRRWSTWTSLACLLLVAACGFTPLYGEKTENGQSPGPILQNIAVQVGIEPSRRLLAQQFKMDLEDRLHAHHSAPPVYQLQIDLVVTETPISISPDGTVARTNVGVEAALRLIRAGDGVAVYQGRARRTSSYNNISNAFYSAYVSAQDATRRATTGLAEDVELRLAAFFAQNPTPGPITPAPAPPLPPPPVPPPASNPAPAVAP